MHRLTHFKTNRESGLSHDQGLSLARKTHSSSKLHDQPALGRPSLFAGMDPDADVGPDRVRILSTLAANRPPSKRASGRRSATRAGARSWQAKALLTLLGLGILAVMAGFAMVLSQGHPEAHPQDLSEPVNVSPPTALTTAPAAVTPAASLPSTPTTMATAAPIDPPPQTAVIEEVAPTSGASLGTTVASASPLAALSTAPMSSAAAPAPAPAAQQTAPKASKLTPAPAAQASIHSRKADKPTARKARSDTGNTARSPETKRGQDADVALLEAMFIHSRPPRNAKEKRLLCKQQPNAAGCSAKR